MFETWTVIVGKLALYSGDISISAFHYFWHLRELSSQRNISTTVITEYMHELEAEFMICGFYNVLCLDQEQQLDEHDLDATTIDWMDTEDMEMQLIEL